MVTSVTFASSNNGAVASSTITFAAQGIGSASSAQRTTVVIAMSNGVSGMAVTQMTIGGITAIQLASTGSSGTFASIWAAQASTGATTATIAMTLSQSSGNLGIAVFNVTNGDSVQSSAIGQTASTAAQSLTTTVASETNSRGVVGYAVNTSSAGLITLTNATLSTQATLTTVKYGYGTITTSGTLSVSASQAIIASCALVMASFQSSVPNITQENQSVDTNAILAFNRTEIVGYRVG